MNVIAGWGIFIIFSLIIWKTEILVFYLSIVGCATITFSFLIKCPCFKPQTTGGGGCPCDEIKLRKFTCIEKMRFFAKRKIIFAKKFCNVDENG